MTNVRLRSQRKTLSNSESELRGFFKLVMSLIAGTVKRQHEGDLRKVKELLDGCSGTRLCLRAAIYPSMHLSQYLGKENIPLLDDWD